MAQPLRIDLDRLRELSPELARIAEAAQQKLTELETSLAAEGQPWGDDEPGRMFSETYEPELNNGLASFRTVVENLGRVGTGLADAADVFQQQDQDGGRLLDGRSPEDRGGPGTTAPYADELLPEGAATSSPVPQTSTAPTAYPETVPATTAGTETTPVTGNPTDPTPWASPQPAAESPLSPSEVGTPDTTNGQPYGATTGQPTTAPGGRTPGGDAPTGVQATTTPAQPAGRTDPSVASRTTPAPSSTTGRAAPENPWSRPRGPAGGTTGLTPWGREGAPAGPGRGQAVAPNTGPPPPPSRQPGQTPRDGKEQRKKEKPVPARSVGEPAATDPAALEAARAFAERHSLRLTGFETSGINVHTVGEIAAALDDILGKYPFLALGGIDIADLPAGVASIVQWDRPTDGSATARIMLRRGDFAEPAAIAERLRDAAGPGRAALGSEDRPVYAIVVRDLGRILVDAAGPPVWRLAEQTLITEYHRISGPWNRGDTLASVVRGYREWRDQFSGACFTRGRLDPAAASVDAFTQVELRAENACGPAKVLHRLMVESGRGHTVP
ncbi:WXG100 family type VII secretion target [Nocardia sp. NBC_00416]|uniref:WXG100 family type VII secretion target n=1 Tax=Nocardia sp. NBC_00416 TaxID=2975991 RepID=UPI002E204CAF